MLRTRLYATRVSTLVVTIIAAVGVAAFLPKPASATTPHYQWIQSGHEVETVVFYWDTQKPQQPVCVVAEIDGQHYAGHVEAKTSTNCRQAYVTLTNRRLGMSTKITLGKVRVEGCERKVPDCSGADKTAKQVVMMHAWSGHPHWKTGRVDHQHILRVAFVHVQRWYRMSCGTNC